MTESASWPPAVGSGVGRLLARYASDLAVEYAYLVLLDGAAVERCVDHRGHDVALDAGFLPLVARIQERQALLMIDDLAADALLGEAGLRGAFLGVGVLDNAGELSGMVLAHGLTPRSWGNQDLERAGDIALAASSIVILEQLRRHAERRIESESRARTIRRQMHTISSRSAQASSLGELARILVRETPALLQADWSAVGVRHRDAGWDIYTPLEQRRRFEAVFGGDDAPGNALCEHIAGVPSSRVDIVAADVPAWAAVRTRLDSPDGARLIGASLADGDSLAMVLMCHFSHGELGVQRSHLFDELLEDVRRVVERTAAAQEQIEAAQALQRSLLPPRVPDLDGYEIGRLYNSAADYSRVGGDWYDVVQIDSSTTGFVVGDVAGHDIRSAAVMGQLRHVLASQLRDRRRPAGALSATDRYFSDLDENVMATAVVVVVDRATHTAHIALAGHPPPVLLSNGHARLVSASPGPPIGFGYGGYLEVAESVVPGDTLVAYSDGVVETRSGDLQSLLDAFVQDFAEVGSSVHELVTFLDRRSKAGELVDDVAALVVRLCRDG